jgi:two-component system sensor kinase FixL
MLDHEGNVHWFRDTPDVHATTEPGTPTITGAVADITDLKNAERDAAERSRELAHVARTSIIGELAAALAHEIRQPLTAILINSQTAVRVLDSQPRDTDAVREILYQLAADGRRAGEVIQRVRAFARKDDLERGPIDLNAMLRDAVQLVRHDTIRRRVEIRFALAHETMIVVGDRVQLQQVVLNLVLNALEALAERPPQSERLVLIETARAAHHTATVTIRDTGPGVALERQAAIFEPFVTSKSNGLGVGLSITRTIVEAHGGIIWCESDPSVGGAAFIVALPLVSHG